MTFRSLCITGLVSFLGVQAQAATVDVTFGGSGVSGVLRLTYGAATDATYPEAFVVTGISGSFSDAGLGSFAVTGALPLAVTAPEPANLLAPASFSAFDVASGLPDENGGALHYDNLYWPGGSVQTATDYPPHGGAFDIYGLLFGIGDGKVVNLWSNGIFGDGPPSYGVAVVTHETALDYVSGVTLSAVPVPVPLPAALWLLGGGLAGLAALSRRRV